VKGKRYGLFRCVLPVGLRATDTLVIWRQQPHVTVVFKPFYCRLIVALHTADAYHNATLTALPSILVTEPPKHNIQTPEAMPTCNGSAIRNAHPHPYSISNKTSSVIGWMWLRGVEYRWRIRVLHAARCRQIPRRRHRCAWRPGADTIDAPDAVISCYQNALLFYSRSLA